MRTGQLSSVGNYRGARSELQSGQDPASKRQERERDRREGEEGAMRSLPRYTEKFREEVL